MDGRTLVGDLKFRFCELRAERRLDGCLSVNQKRQNMKYLIMKAVVDIFSVHNSRRSFL